MRGEERGVETEGTIIYVAGNPDLYPAEYYDAQGRKETYEIQLQRLEAILTEAAELSDIIALETEIARVRYEIEALEKRACRGMSAEEVELLLSLLERVRENLDEENEVTV